jgi:hypothetical protein
MPPFGFTGSGGGGGGGVSLSFANIAGLAGFNASTLDAGATAYVETLRDFFVLDGEALTTDGITVIAAGSKVGFQWRRLTLPNLFWAAQAAWFVDPSNGSGLASDENTGIDRTHPLLTLSEHARRLSTTRLSVGQTVTLMGSQLTTDNPVYECGFPDAAFTPLLTFVGDLTAIHNGTITTSTPGAAAPTADNGDRIADTGLPVSWTASGMLADAILFKRTNSTALWWWGAKDLGTKVLRISRPNDGAGTETALATNDTYTAYSLFILRNVRFTSPVTVDAIEISQLHYTPSAAFTRPTAVKYTNVWFSTILTGGGLFFNPAFGGDQTITPYGMVQGFTSWSGMIRSGTVTLALQASGAWFGRLVVQGGRLVVQGGLINMNDGDVCLYDCTTTGLWVQYWGLLFFAAGALAGNNNATNGAVIVNFWSQLTYTVATWAIAGTFISGTPISVGATAIAVAALPSNQLATLGIGLYRTQ